MQQNVQQTGTAPVMSIKEWLITLIIIAIPVVGFVMAIIWAIQADNPNKRNYFIAFWIFTAIMMVLMIVFMLIFGATIFSMGAAGNFR